MQENNRIHNLPCLGNHSAFTDPGRSLGLTKREFFALHLAQALLSNGKTDFRIAARLGVEAADRLIEELNRINPQLDC